MRFRFVACALSVLIGLACSPRPDGIREEGRYSETQLLMGTTVQIDVCYDEEHEEELPLAYAEVWERLGEIHWRMSSFNDISDVAKVNKAYEHPVEIGDDTYALIENSIGWQERTFGAFDITVWPLMHFWKEHHKKAMPTPEEVAAVRESIGVHKIRMLPDSHVQISDPSVRIDLGGIAKGYAIDEAARILKENGFEQFLVDAGGDVYVSGSNCRGLPWHLGIKDPRSKKELLDIVALEDMAITTSGDYEQYVVIGNEKWSHIINPLTGYPQKGVVSASVIAPTAEEADALSTAMTVLGPEKGVALIESLGEQYGCLILYGDHPKELKKAMSDNFGQWIAAKPGTGKDNVN